jgi:hypothetical protein
MKNFQIKEELAQAVLQYLAKQPYIEVVSLIHGLQSLQPVRQEPPRPATMPLSEEVKPTE